MTTCIIAEFFFSEHKILSLKAEFSIINSSVLELAAELTPKQQFAQELAQFCRDYDLYSFPAPEENTDSLPDDILKDLSSGTDLGIRQWMKQVIDAGDEDSIKAQPLMERL